LALAHWFRRYRLNRLAVAGRYIVVAIVWFQFVAAQIAAPVLLGDAIRSEVRKRTLHVLAVTPLGGMQIVGGKLAGGLLPIVMLLTTSLPLLALVRVLGGVPWDFVVSGVGIAFSALVFAGALHLLVSAGRRSVIGNLGPTLWFCLLGRVPDALIAWFALTRPAIGAIGGPILLLVNPTDILLARTREMLTARPGTGLSAWWPLHCLIWPAASVLVLWLTARRVRAVAAEAVSDRMPESGMYRLGVWVGRKGRRTDGPVGQRPRRTTPIKRVEGSPVLWKELRTFAVRRSRHPLAKYGAPAILACLIAAAGIGMGIFGVGGSMAVIAGSMVFCALGLHVGAAVALSGAAATMIPKEREAGTLPVLLATTLEDGRIVRDKALAVLRQCLPPLVLLFVFLLFSSAGVVASIPAKGRLLLLACVAGGYLGCYLVCLLGSLPFLTGLGLYCGVRLKTAAAARGCTFAVVLLGVVVFCFVTIALLFSVVRSNWQAWLTGAAVVIGTALACAGVGLILLWGAARRLRRNVF
jgi:ABC-type transport system involved in multi-copper enzyme maturation permease subunit